MKKEVHNFRSSSNIREIKSNRMRLVGHVVPMRETNTNAILIGKPEGKG
jgi:hypothetical protein